MSQAGIVDFIGTHPEIPTMFVANVGTAIPIANTIEILGSAVAAHSVPVQTVASGNTLTVDVQYASAAASSVANNAGLASFNSLDFTVDANGFVTLAGSTSVENFTVDAATASGTNPVVPNGSGNITVTGGQVAAGTTTNVIRTDSLAANSYTIQIQRSQAVASSTVGDNGVSHFNSTYFTVDSNGFVSINGAAIGETITGNTGGALSPSAGNWNILGTSTAAGTTPVQTAGSGSTLTVQVQKAQAIATTNATNVGLAAFSSTQFAVDANGFVTLNGAAVGETITGNTGGALSPTAGNWNILGTSTAAGTTPVQTAGSGSTLTVQVQKAQAIASTNATNVGLAAFDSARFSVDGNGFVTLLGTGAGETITGNTGGALSPTGGNWNILGASTAAGTTPVQTAGSGSTLTIQVQKAQAIGSTNATNVGLAAFNSTYFTVDANGFVSLAAGVGAVTFTGDSGTPFSSSTVTITGGTTGLTFAASSPNLTLGGTLIVANGGTGRTSLTNHGVLIGAGTGAITQSSVGGNNTLFAGNAGADPTFQNAATVGSSLVLIQSQTASSSASISFTTGLTTYRAYLLVCNEVWAGTAGAKLQMVVSNNGGSTYASTGYQAGLNYNIYNSTAVTNINSTALYTITGPNQASTSAFAQVWIYTSGGAGDVNIVTGQECHTDNSSGTRAYGNIFGSCSTTSINAIQLAMSSGNIALGTFDLYGLRES